MESLKQTKDFYLEELKKEDLTEKQRDSYLLALKTIERIIKQKEEAEKEREERRKRKKLIKLVLLDK